MAKETITEIEIVGVKNMSIFEKLSAISLEITNVEKNLNVGFGSGSYKAVSEGDVLAAVRPIEAKYRIYSYPVNREIVETGILESYDKNGQVKKQQLLRIKTTYRFINMDETDEFIDIVSYGDGIDSGDKAPGKAMTYADKYALLKAYKIITGDDPDKDPSEPLKGKTVRTTTTAPVKKGVSEDLKKECEELGGSLEKIATKKGMKVEDLTDDIVRPILIAIRKRNALKQAEQKEPQENTVPNQNE